MRKRPHTLSATEEISLVADISLKLTLNTKALMRKYDASRSLIDRVSRETKRLLDEKQHACLQAGSDAYTPDRAVYRDPGQESATCSAQSHGVGPKIS